MKNSTIWIGLCAAFCLFIVSGCGTAISIYDRCHGQPPEARSSDHETSHSICYSQFMEPIPPIYSGTRFDAELIFYPLLPPWFTFVPGIIDLPLSFAADTILLPLTITKAVDCTRIDKELEEAAAEEARKEKEAQERALSIEKRPPILVWEQPNQPQISAVSPTSIPPSDHGVLRENPYP